MKTIRRDLQVVFQDPYASLNPRMSVGEIIGEGPLVHGMTDKTKREALVRELLGKVGLNQSHIHRYPHEFSGGQRQRIGIARALAVNPDFIVCDEPVSALDVSIQSQVLNLLDDLQKEFGLTYLFIAHNLAVVEHISDRVGVMYLGQDGRARERRRAVLEPAPPLHGGPPVGHPEPEPAASARSGSCSRATSRRRRAPPSGCRFHTRCWLRERLGNPERCVDRGAGLPRYRARPPVGVPLRGGDDDRGRRGRGRDRDDSAAATRDRAGRRGPAAPGHPADAAERAAGLIVPGIPGQLPMRSMLTVQVVQPGSAWVST